MLTIRVRFLAEIEDGDYEEVSFKRAKKLIESGTHAQDDSIFIGNVEYLHPGEIFTVTLSLRDDLIW
jgi:hypothetical protein